LNFKYGHYIFHISIVQTQIYPCPNYPIRKNQILVINFLSDLSDSNIWSKYLPTLLVAKSPSVTFFPLPSHYSFRMNLVTVKLNHINATLVLHIVIITGENMIHWLAILSLNMKCSHLKSTLISNNKYGHGSDRVYYTLITISF